MRGSLLLSFQRESAFGLGLRFFTARQRLMWFNDDPRTSHADVMALFDRTIDNLASKVPVYVSA